ncbi:MAG: hypothetical protein AABX71_00055 [Nanoarchaeota archaeon]
MERALKFYLALSMLGTLLLLIISNFTVKEVKIEEIDETLLNKNIRVQCRIISEKNYDNFCVLTCQDETGKIKLTFSKNLNLINKTIAAEGKIIEYRNILEIQADKIEEKIKFK